MFNCRLQRCSVEHNFSVHMIPQHLATLIQAVKQVEPKFVANCSDMNNESSIIYLDERSFAYELYRQWQDLVENSVDDLVINAEVPKECVDNKTFLSRLEKIFGLTDEGKPHRRFFPDLVCHHSQFDSEKQEVICEIKTKSGINDKAKLFYDLKKLAAYMTKSVLLCHPFKVGAFILVGGDFSDIKYKSDKTIDNKKDELFCILYNIKIITNDKGNILVPNVQCRSLREIVNSNKQKK